jgi:hypothetical protein
MDNLQKLYFDRLLTDIKKGLHRDVFNNRQIKFPEYRRLFKDYLDKHLKPEDVTSQTYKTKEVSLMDTA